MDETLRRLQRDAAQGDPDAEARRGRELLRSGDVRGARPLLFDAARAGSGLALDALAAFAPDLSRLRARARVLTWEETLPGPRLRPMGGPLGTVALMWHAEGRALAYTEQAADYRVFEVDLERWTCRDRWRVTERPPRSLLRLEDGRWVRTEKTERDAPLPYAEEVESRWLEVRGERSGRVLRWADHRRLRGEDFALVYGSGLHAAWANRPSIPRHQLGWSRWRIGPRPDLWRFEPDERLCYVRADQDEAEPVTLLRAQHSGRFRCRELASGGLLVAETRGGLSPSEEHEQAMLAWREADYIEEDDDDPEPVQDPEVHWWRIPYDPADGVWRTPLPLGATPGRLQGDPLLWADGQHVLAVVGRSLIVVDGRAGTVHVQDEVRTRELHCGLAAPDGRAAWWLVDWPDDGSGALLRVAV